jgi:DNA-binding transcriptional LysR family regulator
MYDMVHIFLDMDDLFGQNGLSMERLRTFCLVVEAGGFTKAAGGDAARQPLFSRQIRELEAFFGVELLKRSGKKIAVTKEGAELARLIRNYFSALGDFKKTCLNRPTKVRLGAGDSIIQWLILPQLPEIKKRMPTLQLELINLPTNQIVEQLGDGLLDMGIVRQTSVSSGIESIVLGRMDFGVFVPRKWSKLDWSQLLQQGSFAVLEGSGEFRQQLATAAGRENVHPRIEVECSSFPAVVKAMNCAGLAGLLPLAAGIDLKREGFTQLEVPWTKQLSRQMVLLADGRACQIKPSLGQVYGELGKLLSVG